MKFKEAMSNKTLQEYAEPGRLIKKAKIEEPMVPDRAEYRLDSSNPPTYRHREVPICEFKQWQAKIVYFILKFLSEESLRAVG